MEALYFCERCYSLGYHGLGVLVYWCFVVVVVAVAKDLSVGISTFC
jgi:hypothetical protein